MTTRRIFLASFATAFAFSARSEDSAVDPAVLSSIRVVEDPDGFTNLRAGPSAEAKIVGKVPAGGVVAIGEPSKSGWMAVMQDGPGPSAYIHSSRLRSVEKWKTIVPASRGSAKQARLASSGFEVAVAATPFQAEKHRITREGNGSVRVDGLNPWGQDGGLPKNGIALTVSLNGTAVKLPSECVRNLYEPNPETLTLLTPGSAAQEAFVLMENSDGAGGYCVVWAFKDGRYLNRVVFAPD